MEQGKRVKLVVARNNCYFEDCVVKDCLERESDGQGLVLRLDAFQAIQAIQAVQAIQARIAQWIGKYWRNRIHVISF